MPPHWTSRVTLRALGYVFRMAPSPFRLAPCLPSHGDDADARRVRSDLDAIRTRFPDHA